MNLKKKILSEIEASVDRLVKASLKEIDRMLRNGATFEEILANLRSFKLPPNEAGKLEGALQKAMDEISAQRKWALNELQDKDIEEIKSLNAISIPKLQKAISGSIMPTVRKAIATGMGPTALMHELKNLEFEKPKTLANTAIAQFNNELTFAQAEMSGVETFQYFGPLAPSTRPFCRAHVGKIFTLAEIERMDNGQGISVRSSCGGYNCRHYWLAVPNGTITKKQEVIVGKQKLLMDEKTKQEFFAYHRRYYVEANKMNYKTLEEYKIADALAYAHDGMNAKVTGQLPYGNWWQRLYKKEIDGKKRIITNFEYHVEKRIKNDEIKNANEYRTIIKNIIEDNDSDVYKITADDGSLRYLVYQEKTNWLVMIDKYGALRTAFFVNTNSKIWQSKVYIGKLNEYIGVRK